MKLKVFYLSVLLTMLLGSVAANEHIIRIDSLYNTLSLQSGREKAETLLKLSEAYRYISFDKTVETGLDALQQSDVLGYTALKAKTLRSLGTSALMISDYDLALRYYNESLEVYHTLNDFEGLAACYNNMGMIMRVLGDYAQANEQFERSIRYEQKLGNNLGVAETYHNLGNNYYDQAMLDQAMEYYYRARLIFEEEGDNDSMAEIDVNMASVYMQWNDIPKAISLIHRAVEHFVMVEDYRSLGAAFNNLALIYLYDYKDPLSAIDYFLKAVEFRESAGDVSALALTHSNLGYAYAKTGDFEEAEKYLAMGEHVFELLGNVQGMITTNLFYGYSHQLKGDYRKSSIYLDAALEQSQEYNVLMYISDILIAQMKNYAALGNFNEFLLHFDAFMVEYDTTIKQLYQSQLNESRARERYDFILAEMANMQEQNIQMSKQIRNFRFYFAALAGIITLIFLIAMVRRQSGSKQHSKRIGVPVKPLT